MKIEFEQGSYTNQLKNNLQLLTEVYESNPTILSQEKVFIKKTLQLLVQLKENKMDEESVILLNATIIKPAKNQFRIFVSLCVPLKQNIQSCDIKFNPKTLKYLST